LGVAQEYQYRLLIIHNVIPGSHETTS